MNSEKKGVYIHIPFCRSKCPYCDFYSVVRSKDEELFDLYEKTLLREIAAQGSFSADTVYFGGGTPSEFSPERIDRILTALSPKLEKDCEITLECNPKTVDTVKLRDYYTVGINRLSVGVQSFDDRELKALGRIHSADDAKRTIDDAFSAGFENVCADLMIATPNQTIDSLRASIDSALSLGVKQISAYILTVEPNTVFGRKGITLPDDDIVAQMYLGLANRLERGGLMQYEISNFAAKGFESRHNLKYWNCEEYYGFGTSAHSFINGVRYCHGRDIDEYIKSNGRIYKATDKSAGGLDEYIMLKLRLCEGLSLEKTAARYKAEKEIDKRLKALYYKAKQFENAGFMRVCKDRVSLTKKGFLVSNSVIAELIDN